MPSFVVRADGAGEKDWECDTGDEGGEAFSIANLGGWVFGDEIFAGVTFGDTSEATLVGTSQVHGGMIETDFALDLRGGVGIVPFDTRLTGAFPLLATPKQEGQ